MPDSDQTESSDAKPREPGLRHDPPEVPGYRLQERSAIPISRLNRIGLALAIPFGVLFFLIGIVVQGGSGVDLDFSLVTFLILLGLVLIGVPLIHEALHGIVAIAVGAKPFYGIGQGFAYTSFREPVTPAQYGLISAAPLVIISLLSVVAFALVPAWFLFIVIFATTNAAGAVGDLWILNRLRQLPSDALIYDLADGYAAFVPAGVSPDQA